jgi:hypothetical protein
VSSPFVPPPKITVASQPTINHRFWRCSACGKWSHAKRKPRTHERIIPWGKYEEWCDAEGVDIYPVDRHGITEESRMVYKGVPVVNVVTDREPDTNALVEVSVVLACGPFETWEGWQVG